MATRPSARAEPSPRLANRELSFLEFNQRIVQEAADPRVPLLERLKFVAILGANLDEFFMVRVAGLHQQVKSGVDAKSPDGLTPQAQRVAIRARVARQVRDIEAIALDVLLPTLRAEGVAVLAPRELSVEARRDLEAHFRRRLFGVLTPLAVDSGRPFPLLRNRSMNLAVHLVPAADREARPRLAVVQIPPLVPRFVPVDGPGSPSVVFVEDAIRWCVGDLFPGMKILECAPFRVLRNWDLSFDEDEQDDLLATVRKELQRRLRLDPVRLEVAGDASEGLVERLRTALGIDAEDVARFRGPLGWADWHQLIDAVDRPELRDPPFEPVRPATLAKRSIYAAVREGDVLLHHPYESYDPVLDLVALAAEDPSVLAIKQTLYRVNRDSPLLQSLIRAAEGGKQVTALVELKARFDEEVNVEWGRQLEEAGAHVVYGLLGLKTHCKVTLVVRRESDGIRRYVHLGTGNYNEDTARVYADLSYFTCRPDVGADISALFNLLTGYSAAPAWKKLSVAPLGLRRRLLAEIDRAARAAKAGRSAGITFKTNALIDPETITALAAARRAGVEVTLLVRGPCTLPVGQPGATDGIVVRMVIDRFLEHARVFHFRVDDDDAVFITSTDVMPRNFDGRVEVMLPVEDPALKRRIVGEILGGELRDDVKAAVLRPDGTYARVVPAAGAAPFRVQAAHLAQAAARAQPEEPPAPLARGRWGRAARS
jgi:polyphosphate kinase